MRTLSGPAITALASATAPIALLVEMDLTSPLNLNTTNADIITGGKTYYGTKGLGKIGAINDTPAEIKGLSFELAGAPATSVALALTEKVQGKAVRIKLAVLDPADYTSVLDVQQCWAGALDVMTIADDVGDTGAGTSTIAVTAETLGIDLPRPRTSLLSDDEQQRLHSGDLFLQYLADQIDQRLIWPTRQFFQQ